MSAVEDPTREAASKDEAIVIPAIRPDGSLEPVGKLDAHRTGQLHLAVSVFMFDREGRLLVQRRAASKYHCGGLWANTCCTHPHWGEPLEDAAHRRLFEEVGARAELTERRTIDYRADVGGGLTEHERVTMYRAEAGADGLALALDPDEVDEVEWWSIDRLAETQIHRPETLAPWFRIYLERFPTLDF